jgi:hypothetical protein
MTATCESCLETTPAELLTLTADSHRLGPNLVVCEGCSDLTGME